VRVVSLLLCAVLCLSCFNGKMEPGNLGLVGSGGGGGDGGDGDGAGPPEIPSNMEEKRKPASTFDEIPLPPFRFPNPYDRNSDVDCDGIPDWEEMEKVYANGKKTDPLNRDTDGDGIWDGVEIGRFFSPDPLCENYFPRHLLSATGRTITDPTRQDTDCDGISDGDEDKNKNGQRDAGETDPTNPDTDDDGLWDGTELGVTQGNILLGGRMVALGSKDSVCEERPPRQYAAQCPPGSRRSLTNPLNPDSDGDGVWDGAEDSNKNGCFEPELGETDPLNPNDIDEETWNACAEKNLVKVDIHRNFAAQTALGLPMGFANSYVNIQREKEGVVTTGLMGMDAIRNVAFVAWQHPDRVGDFAQLRLLATLQTIHLSGNATIGAFTSWDAPSKEANALSVTFTVSGSMSTAERANAIATRLLGEGRGRLANQGTAKETQHIRAQYVLRSNGEVIVVMAVAQDNGSVGGSHGFFGLVDVAGGAALARYFDRTVVQCERSTALRKEVDILFVVDDSGSMTSSQTRLATAGAAMGDALGNSTLDWRVALVTSSYHLHSGGGSNAGKIRGFTDNTQQFQSWLTKDSNCNVFGQCSGSWDAPAPTCGGAGTGANGGCWIGTSGYGSEGMLGAARLALMDLNDAKRLRKDADILVVILSDAEDQTSGLNSSYPAQSHWEDIQNFVDFFQGKGPHAIGKGMQVNAVYCPSGGSCGDDVVPSYADGITRIQRVANETGGLSKSIMDSAAISSTMAEVVNRVIGSGGVKTKKPLVGASLRVAIQNPVDPTNCDKANIPRSRKHGFDYDGIAQTVSFFGDCRPKASQNNRVAISYRAWETSNRLPCENDIHFDASAADHCQGRFVCDIEKDACVCPTEPMCGGCSQSAPQCMLETCTCASILG